LTIKERRTCARTASNQRGPSARLIYRKDPPQIGCAPYRPKTQIFLQARENDKRRTKSFYMRDSDVTSTHTARFLWRRICGSGDPAAFAMSFGLENDHWTAKEVVTRQEMVLC
jgi:hypothetical protein